MLLASPSSCDAERVISTLNRIVTSLRNRLSRESIRMHLIGAEDICEQDYPYDYVATTWAQQKRRRRCRTSNTPKRRSKQVKGKKTKKNMHIVQR
mmetsp:Transcript_102885/g.177534  ORF Transcript_102885/g.177534 Transcript_102885/m.177534 type:complete len:95 (-) Transcript_102885:78-362(-)